MGVWMKVKSLSRVWLFVTPWIVAYQAPLSMGFSRQEYWSGLPFPSPGSSRHRDRTLVSHIAGRYFNLWAIRETPLLSNLVLKTIIFNADYSKGLLNGSPVSILGFFPPLPHLHCFTPPSVHTESRKIWERLGQIISCLSSKSFNGFPFLLGKSPRPGRAFMAMADLVPITSLFSSPITVFLTYSTSATLAFLLFIEKPSYAPTFGP